MARILGGKDGNGKGRSTWWKTSRRGSMKRLYFSPDTVEHLQQLIWTRHPPVRMIETPVYDFAA
jgi:hypothetical protein